MILLVVGCWSLVVRSELDKGLYQRGNSPPPQTPQLNVVSPMLCQTPTDPEDGTRMKCNSVVIILCFRVFIRKVLMTFSPIQDWLLL